MTERAPAAAPGPKTPRAAELRRLERRPEVREALEQATPAPAPPPAGGTANRDRFWLACAAGLVILGLGAPPVLDRFASELGLRAETLELIRRVARGALLFGVVLGAARLLSLLLIERIHDPASRYNLRKVVDLLAAIGGSVVAATVVFTNWYTAAVSLGIASLLLGFALQTPITSLLAWVYILVRRPYRVGDRIRIGEATGDVLEVGYLDTTLWEFGGEYLSTDHPSGRIIKFPNSNVLSTPVYNYSWPLFPYIWNEIKFQIAYESDLEWVAATMQEVAEKELGEAMMAHVRTYRALLARTAVDELEVRERPAVFFRVGDATWLEAIVRYLVKPKEAGRVKSRLIQELLARLKEEPDRVLFPKSNLR